VSGAFAPDLELRDGIGLIRAVREGALSVADVCEGFVRSIRDAEEQVHAFAHFDEEAIFRQAKAIDARARKGSLAGLVIGVKDNYDTMDFPTGYGSPIYDGHRPSRDSAVVARLKAHGALIIGKTATAEFAFMHTGATRNPHGLTRTPGSSSAGSAAGMAAGFFPLALGTQTAGSIIKPASYCGSYAYKPTFGSISLEGIKPFAPSFDTVGWFGRSVDDTRLVAEVLMGGELGAGSPSQAPAHILVAKTEFWGDADPAAKAVLESAVERLLGCGYRVEEASAPFDYPRLASAHQMVNDQEGSRSLAYEYEWHRPLLSDAILRMKERALAQQPSEEVAAARYIRCQAEEMDRYLIGIDAILTLSTAYEAPEGLTATGTSDFIKTWSALGMPQMNLPIGFGPNRMPIGLQLVGRRRDDARLFRVAKKVCADLGVEFGRAPLGGVQSGVGT
jgi:Asp-tRNA(Asn)/Glu-tRNA(Gln) amidotransferase A subunit family amidase